MEKLRGTFWLLRHTRHGKVEPTFSHFRGYSFRCTCGAVRGGEPADAFDVAVGVERLRSEAR